MEKKKFDINSLIGILLIGGILAWMTIFNRPTPEELEAEKAKTEQTTNEEVVQDTTTTTKEVTPTEINVATVGDSLGLQQLKNRLGSFAYSGTLPSASEGTTTIENDVLELTVSNKGGYIVEAKLKTQTQYTGDPVYLIKDGNNKFDLEFQAENRTLHTQDLYFEPTTTSNNGNPVLAMRLKTAANSYLEYRYELKPGEYMLDFSIRTQGLDGVMNTSQPIYLDWQLKGYRQAQSITYENRYTRLTYEHEDGGDHSKLGAAGEDEETEVDVNWMNFRQHFFSSMLFTDKPFKEVYLTSEDLVKEDTDTTYTKQYGAKMLLEPTGLGLSYDMNMYYGPTDYKIFKKYDRNLDEALPLGWGIFGLINKYMIIPVFGVLSNWLPAGIAIIVLTILFKLLLSPVQYKQYVSQAKMKVLKPEMDAIKKKYEGNQMKIQQETLKLQNIAGASPLKGCLPALLQIPVFYALFTFFPTAFDLRQKSFLWADDLASYDVIYEFPPGWSIPLYGSHVSLFPILASIAIFIYMMMSTGQQMQQQQQPGMPNMKFLMYLSPLFMLVFFNQYASGLSLYYLTSNLITIGIMLVIKKFIIDEDKIHAKIEANKKKPKKQNRFQRKMSTMMEQAEAQKAAQKKRK